MDKREKVIKEIETFIKIAEAKNDDYADCVPVCILHDVLHLINAHEAKRMNMTECPHCHFYIGTDGLEGLGGKENINYCPKCGNPVVW